MARALDYSRLRAPAKASGALPMRNFLFVEDQTELAAILAATAQELGVAPLVAGCGKDALALAERTALDGALVDLVLPDMKGAELVRQLSARAIPCFAMSGVPEGDAAALEALEAGAVEFIQKPFAPREILQALLARVSEPHGPPEPSDAEALEELLPLEETASGTGALDDALDADDSDFLDTRHLEVDDAALASVEAVAVELESEPPPAQVLAGAGGEPPAPPAPSDARSAGGPAGESASADAPPAAFDAKPAQDVSPTAEVPAPEGARSRQAFSWPLEGLLAERPVAQLLAGFHERRATGELRLRRGDVLKVLGLCEGRVHFAASNLKGERLVSFAVKSGRLSREAGAQVQAEVARAKGRSADAMVALGLATREDVVALVAQQVREVAWSLLDWADGSYQVALSARLRPAPLDLGLEPIGPLLVEGYRRALSLVRLRELVPEEARFEPAPDPPLHPADLGLGPEEAQVLAHADGTKDVEDLMLLSGLDERATLAVLRALWQAGVVRPRACADSRRRVVLV